MKIEYKQGLHNTVAYALSRMDEVSVETLALSIVEWGDLIPAAYQCNHKQMQCVKLPVNKKETCPSWAITVWVQSQTRNRML